MELSAALSAQPAVRDSGPRDGTPCPAARKLREPTVVSGEQQPRVPVGTVGERRLDERPAALGPGEVRGEPLVPGLAARSGVQEHLPPALSGRLGRSGDMAPLTAWIQYAMKVVAGH